MQVCNANPIQTQSNTNPTWKQSKFKSIQSQFKYNPDKIQTNFTPFFIQFEFNYVVTQIHSSSIQSQSKTNMQSIPVQLKLNQLKSIKANPAFKHIQPTTNQHINPSSHYVHNVPTTSIQLSAILV